MKVDIEKIYWAFWQSSWAYDYGNGMVCLFDVIIKSRNNPNEIGQDFYFYGQFMLHKIFKMKDGKSGVNKSKPPLNQFVQTKPTTEITENDFKLSGISECFEQYSNPQIIVNE